MTSTVHTSEAWLARSEPFGDAIRDYHFKTGGQPDTPGLRASVVTNTTAIPKRGDGFLALLGELAGDSIDGKRVLDVGCGFGALSSYFAWTGNPSELLATDLRADHIEYARNSIAALELGDRLRYEPADMTNLRAVSGDREFDVVLCINAIIYLRRRGAIEQALSEFARVLRPGGSLLLYQANLLRFREPFSGDPLIHLLPKPLADPVSKATGWQHKSHIRYWAPPVLARKVRRAGFEDVRHRPWAGRDYKYPAISDYFALAGRRSA